MGVRDFRVFVLGYRAQNKTRNYGKSLFLGYKAERHVDLFYDHYFNFLSV